MKKTMLLALSTLLALSLFACGGNSTETASESPAAMVAEESAVPETAEESAAPEVAEEAATPELEVAAADVPEAYNEWIPGGAENVQASDVNGQVGVGFQTNASFDETVKFYEDKLAADGATETMKTQEENAYMYAGALSDGRMITVVVASAEGVTGGAIAILEQ